ncbi:MAG: tyrosine-type recombinase/integrase [Verrucomicrobiales bacterium]|nr:tyrosine-type recombinase/integrase [Verrucomicrobiales bacterium]
MIQQLFLRPFVRRRMAASHLGIILEHFALDLQARGYAVSTVQFYVQVAEHFSRWLGGRRLTVREIDEQVVDKFVREHLPRCRCPIPAATSEGVCRPALRCLVRFLREQKLTPMPSPQRSHQECLVEEYDRYLREVGGLAVATRLYRRRYAREFLDAVGCGSTDAVAKIRRRDVVQYIEESAGRLKPASASVLAVSVRDFLRFLGTGSRVDPKLSAAVSHPAPWPLATLPRVLSKADIRALFSAFDRKSAVGRRDLAIATLMADLGLRCQEVASLTLGDLDVQQCAIRLRQTKQRRDRLVPWTPSVARTLSAYLRRGRLPSSSDSLFVRHRAFRGSPMRVHHVRAAMRMAFARAGIRSGKIHVLRHTLATRLHSTGVDLKKVADLLGHQSLDTTARYARVDVEQLRQAVLPWPGGVQ